MNKRRVVISGLIFVVFSFFAVQAVFAGNIKERMKKRLPQIVQMKKQGIIGENFRGYLEFVSAKKINEALVANENRDRKKIYSAIAKQQNAAIKKVEELRGIQIVQKAHKGEYLKKKDGTWYKK
ncbi:MAG: DUF1318 domain-containing protein [Thermodesulfobacteriota bacterium]|nr:DUF1318 domain-containing protein [Thermodesulfobacteriota bacterium]